MSSVADRLKDLQERQEKEKALGGPDRIKKQHDSGKLTARERMDILFDPKPPYQLLDLFSQIVR